VEPVCDGRVETEVADVTVREDDEPPDGDSPLELGASGPDDTGGEVGAAGGGVMAAVEDGSVCAETRTRKLAISKMRVRNENIFALS